KTHPETLVFKMREVTLGAKNGENYTILEGLSNGEEVVVNGTFTVDAAAQLQGKKSMMNTNEQSEMDPTDHLADIERLEVSSKFQEQLKAVFDHYIIIKKALVKDDADIPNKVAVDLIQSLEKIDGNLVKNEPGHSHWMLLEKELHES